VVLGSLTAFNLNISIRRARDVQRRGDLGAISNALEKFHMEYGFFPPAEGGKIKFCKASNYDEILALVKEKNVFDRELFFQGLRPCDWGRDAFVDVISNDNEIYMQTLPSDPKTAENYSYYYLSNSNRFQLYSFLEGGKSEIGYDEGIITRDLPCGTKVCSFGKSYANTPLDKSIEEYEAELFQEQNKSRQ